jgi:hypothetical protein
MRSVVFVVTTDHSLVAAARAQLAAKQEMKAAEEVLRTRPKGDDTDDGFYINEEDY